MGGINLRIWLACTSLLVSLAAEGADAQTTLDHLASQSTTADFPPAPYLTPSAAAAYRQIGPAARPALATQATAATTTPALPSDARTAIAYFGGDTAAATLARMPRRPSLPPGGTTPIGPPRPRTKPFSGASNGVTVTPYLNLYREENEESAPNYYAFVRPQLQQQEVNRRQQAELQRLGRQVQRATTTFGQTGPDGSPLTGHRTRFLDTGSYFSGVGQQQ